MKTYKFPLIGYIIKNNEELKMHPLKNSNIFSKTDNNFKELKNFRGGIASRIKD